VRRTLVGLKKSANNVFGSQTAIQIMIVVGIRSVAKVSISGKLEDFG
jgi:hypothetical protein